MALAGLPGHSALPLSHTLAHQPLLLHAELGQQKQKEGLEAEFKDAVDQALKRISAAPVRFGPVRGEVRPALLRRLISAQQRDKTCLLKMPVASERFSHAFVGHHQERNAIG